MITYIHILKQSIYDHFPGVEGGRINLLKTCHQRLSQLVLLVVRIGKRSPEWQWLKDKGKALENRTKEGLETGVKTSDKTNSPPG